MTKVSEQSLIDIEIELNKVYFNSIPLGGTLANFLQVDFLIGKSDLGGFRLLKEWVRSVYIKYIGIHFVRKNKKHIPSGLSSGLPLLTVISERPHLFKINHAVWRYGSNYQFNCLLKSNKLTQLFSGSLNSVSFEELPFESLTAWRKKFIEIKRPLEEVLTSFVRKNGLPVVFKRIMINELAVQTQRIMAFEMLLKQLKPSYILTEYDRNGLCSGLVLVARKLNIPTFSHMHGVVNHRFGYLPLLADYLFCWGNRQKELLVKLGANPDRLIVSGATQLSDQTIEIDRKELLNKLDVHEDQKIVILATNPINDEDRLSLISIFCDAVDQLPQIKGIVRLHPSEDIEFYKNFRDSFPEILFDKNQTLNFEESLALADLVCIFNSAYGIDACVKNIPTMIINLNSDNLGQAADLIDNGAFPFAENSDGLKSLIQEFFTNEEWQLKTIENQNKYAKSYCTAFGEDAADIILDEINSQISNTLIANE